MQKVSYYPSPVIHHESKKNINAKNALISLVIVGACFVALGILLIYLSGSPHIIRGGYGFVAHFVGVHSLGLGGFIMCGTFLFFINKFLY